MKLAIITGGSRGLGGSLVSVYTDNGWEVKELSRTGDSRYSINCNFDDRAQASLIIEGLFSDLGKVKWNEVIVFNNVGTLNPIGKIHEKRKKDWFTNIDVNMMSMIIVTGYFLKYFQNHEASKYIVNISSGAAHKTYAGWSLYCACKSAMESFSHCIAIEQSSISNGAKAIIINPGVMDTKMQSRIRSTNKHDFPGVGRFKDLNTKGELPNPFETAKIIFDIINSKPENGKLYNVSDFMESK